METCAGCEKKIRKGELLCRECCLSVDDTDESISDKNLNEEQEIEEFYPEQEETNAELNFDQN